jgi:FkbM family methyltransferase
MDEGQGAPEASGRPLARVRRLAGRVARRALATGVRTLERSRNALILGARFDALGPGPRLGLVQDGEEAYVVFANDQIISRDLFLHGNRHHTRVERALARLEDFRLDTLVDVGANIGIVSISAVLRGLARRAIAIEPVPQNHRLLVANIHLNGLADRITHHATALGAVKDETLSFELSPDNSGDHRVSVAAQDGLFAEGQRPRIQVPSTRFDDLVGDLDPRGTLIWMESQGYEGHILTGAPRALAARVPLVAEFCTNLKRPTGAYAPFLEAVSGYRTWIDLFEDDAPAVPLTRESLEQLAERLGDRGKYTDLLFS